MMLVEKIVFGSFKFFSFYWRDLWFSDCNDTPSTTDSSTAL